MCKKIILIGAGGHGLVVAEIALLNGYREVYFLDDNINKEYDYPILGKIESFPKYNDCDFFVSIGNNHFRKKIIENLLNENKSLATLIHPSAIISKGCEVGIGTVIMPGAILNCKSKIGQGSIINTASIVEHENEIGNFVHLSPGCHLSGQVKIQDETWLGTGCNVVNNVSICKKCIIGAGSTITDDIDMSGTFVGTPARRIK